MKACDAVIAWNTYTGEVTVLRHPDFRSGRGWMDEGAAYAHWRSLDDGWRVAMVFVAFNTMTLRDGIDPQRAHAALWTIDEYRAACAPDTPPPAGRRAHP